MAPASVIRLGPPLGHPIESSTEGARRAVLDPPDVEDGGPELDLVPSQVAQLGRSQAMPEGDQDHGGVPVPVAVGLGRLDQGLDLAGGEVLPGAKLGVRTPCRRNCS